MIGLGILRSYWSMLDYHSFLQDTLWMWWNSKLYSVDREIEGERSEGEREREREREGERNRKPDVS